MSEKLRAARAMAGWVTSDKKLGQGDGTVELTVLAFTGRNNRTSVVTVVANGGQSKEVQVIQNGKPVYVTKVQDPNVAAGITTATVSFKTNSASFKLELSGSATVGSVKVNQSEVPELDGTYTPSGDPGANGEYTVEVVVNFPANDDVFQKQYTVKATDSTTGSATSTATITQSAADSRLTVSPEQLTFEATGGSQTITITSNDSWTIS